MSSPAARLITLIMLLQRRPNQRAGELAAALGVSVRTLHRYIAELDEMGIPIYSERGPNGGFSLVRGYKMPPLMLTPEEAVVVSLGAGLVGEMWGPLYCEAATGAQAKLDNVLPAEQRQEVAWARRSLVAMAVQRGDAAALAPVLETLRRATREKRVISILYRSQSRPAPTWREVDVYALVHRWGWWYAVGYCHLREAVRMFRLDRIDELALLSRSFAMPPRFDVRAFLEKESAAQPQVRAMVRFVPQWAFLALDNRALWETLAEAPDGSVTATLLAPDLTWAAATIFSFGPALEVEGPEELREVMRQWIWMMAGTYGLTLQKELP